MDLAGAAALVTGASSGIGFAVAEALAAEGARLVLVARGRGPLERAAQEIAAGAKTEAHPLPLDVTRPEASREAVRFAERRFGRLDAAVACAGAHAFGSAEENAAVAGTLFQVNALAKAHLAAACAPGMRARRRGHLVFLSSMAATVPLPGQSAYCASMAAVDHLARSLDAELRGDGVRVHAYAPGLVDTPLARRQFTDLAERRFAAEGLRGEALRARVERFWTEETLSPRAVAGDVVAMLKSPGAYPDPVVVRPPKVVL